MAIPSYTLKIYVPNGIYAITYLAYPRIYNGSEITVLELFVKNKLVIND